MDVQLLPLAILIFLILRWFFVPKGLLTHPCLINIQINKSVNSFLKDFIDSVEKTKGKRLPTKKHSDENGRRL